MTGVLFLERSLEGLSMSFCAWYGIFYEKEFAASLALASNERRKVAGAVPSWHHCGTPAVVAAGRHVHPRTHRRNLHQPASVDEVHLNKMHVRCIFSGWVRTIAVRAEGPRPWYARLHQLSIAQNDTHRQSYNGQLDRQISKRSSHGTKEKNCHPKCI